MIATVIPLRDPKAAARARRYRRRKRDARNKPEIVTPTVTVSTIGMMQLAARVGAGTVTAEDLQMAERLLLVLAAMLPADGAIAVPTP